MGILHLLQVQSSIVKIVKIVLGWGWLFLGEGGGAQKSLAEASEGSGQAACSLLSTNSRYDRGGKAEVVASFCYKCFQLHQAS